MKEIKKIYGARPSGYEHWGAGMITSNQAGIWYALGWAGYHGQLKEKAKRDKDKTFFEIWIETVLIAWGMKKGG